MLDPDVIRHYAKADSLAPTCGADWRPYEILTGRKERVNCKACLTRLQERKGP